MYAMQYEITLPAAYDMALIRHRVATKGPLLDGFAGVGLRAYLIRERGRDGSPVNQYAPFYLWADTDGMGRFLPGVHCSALAVDPRHWQLVHFTLWRDSSPPMAGTRHQVLHLSRGSAP